MTAQSATGPTTTPTFARKATAWIVTWILPLVLGTAVVFAYLLMIVPKTDRPWYMPPTPKPGKSVIFRSLNHVHQVSDDAQAKAERKARLDERRKAAAEKAAKREAKIEAKKGTAGGEDPPGSADPGALPATTTRLEGLAAPATGTPPVAEPTPGAGPAQPDPQPDPTVADAALTGQPASTARSRAQLDALWREHGEAPLEGEPIDESWAQAHKSLHYQLFALARDVAFHGAPDSPSVSLRDAACRTIRCELVLAGAYHHELTILTDALAELKLRRASLWRGFERGTLESKPAPTGDGTIYELRLIVAFADDLIAPGDVKLGKRKLLPLSQMSPTGATHH